MLCAFLLLPSRCRPKTKAFLDLGEHNGDATLREQGQQLQQVKGKTTGRNSRNAQMAELQEKLKLAARLREEEKEAREKRHLQHLLFDSSSDEEEVSSDDEDRPREPTEEEDPAAYWGWVEDPPAREVNHGAPLRRMPSWQLCRAKLAQRS